MVTAATIYEHLSHIFALRFANEDFVANDMLSMAGLGQVVRAWTAWMSQTCPMWQDQAQMKPGKGRPSQMHAL